MPAGAQQTMKTATVMDMMKAERRSFFSSSLILRSDASLTRVSGRAQIWHSSRVEVAPFVSAEESKEKLRTEQGKHTDCVPCLLNH